MENKSSILRAASLIARSLEVTIRGLPDIKNPPSPLINPFNPQKSFSSQFFWPVYRCMRCERAEAGSPPGGLCCAQHQHGDLYHAWKRKFGGMEVSEAKRLRGKLAAQASGGRPSGADSDFQRGQRKKVVRAVCKTTGCEDECARRLGKSDGGLLGWDSQIELLPKLSAICFTSSSAPLEPHSVRESTHWSLCDSYMRDSRDLPSKTMKRPNSTSLRRRAGTMKAGNLEKELKEIRQRFAWMRTEQKEMKRWIHDALRNPGSLSRS